MKKSNRVLGGSATTAPALEGCETAVRTAFHTHTTQSSSAYRHTHEHNRHSLSTAARDGMLPMAPPPTHQAATHHRGGRPLNRSQADRLRREQHRPGRLAQLVGLQPQQGFCIWFAAVSQGQPAALLRGRPPDAPRHMPHCSPPQPPLQHRLPPPWEARDHACRRAPPPPRRAGTRPVGRAQAGQLQ